ncbi:HpcH/HpaI aldolase/citrate lyase family protein [Rhodococcus spongiicola]|uniref:CoA ester lyase n=1 Tax=Rhodococcus spongiicola TaxID=2487352 RepID=A0A438APA1_9NOCA|nr:CoA ester lyase [Rhodococcus spongiicola]RVW00394.1 CoA ester lyase [Rhodococcus spongiicola]
MTPRSWLYVPGHRADRIEKAVAGPADAVVIDLEDAVPVHAKTLALANALDALEAHPDRTIWVRISAGSGACAEAEVDALMHADARPAGIRVPKAEVPAVLASIAERVCFEVHALVESAAGLLGAPELARCHPRVTGIALGEADLAADLRVRPDGLVWARGWIVAAARAAQLGSPVQSVWTDVADLDGLAESSRLGLTQGFFGRSVVHPSQIAPVNAAYTPDAAEVETARRVVGSATRSECNGESAVLDTDGRFIDPAVIANARVVLDRAERYEHARRNA